MLVTKILSLQCNYGKEKGKKLAFRSGVRKFKKCNFGGNLLVLKDRSLEEDLGWEGVWKDATDRYPDFNENSSKVRQTLNHCLYSAFFNLLSGKWGENHRDLLGKNKCRIEIGFCKV